MHQVSGRGVRIDQFWNLSNVIDRTSDPYDRIERSPDLLRPIIAAKDVAEDEGDRRHQIAETVFDSFAPQLDLSFAAAIYGLRRLVPGLAYSRAARGLPPASASLRPMRASPAA